MEKIPLDVLYNHIIPYTYQKIDSRLLNDIRNFICDYNIIINYYYFDMNEYCLIHDLLLFCNGNGNGNGNDSLIDFLNRNTMFNNLSLDKKYEYIQDKFYTNFVLNAEKKIKFLFSLLTPSERACFINKYIIDYYD